MAGEPRFVRFSDRGKWHRVARVIDSTGSLVTSCGRVIAPIRMNGWEVAGRVPVVTRCEKCQKVKKGQG